MRSAAGRRALPPTAVLALSPTAPDLPDSPPALLPLGPRTALGHLLGTLDALGQRSPLLIAPPGICDAVRSAHPQVRCSPIEAPPHALRAAALRRAAEELTAAHPRSAERLLILDAERALTPASSVTAVLEAAQDEDDLVLPLIEVTDSVKAWDGDRLHNVDRAHLGSPQAPQLWRDSVLVRVAETLEGQAQQAAAPAAEALPEVRAALAEGAQVRTVRGSHQGFAITDRLSLWQAQIALGPGRGPGREGGTLRGMPRRG